MIRINLLPVRQAKKREYGKQQLVLFFFLVILEAVILYTVYMGRKDQVAILDQRIADLQEAVAEVPTLEDRQTELQAQIAQRRATREMLANLQSNRIGPGAVLEDLMYIMNSPENQVEERAQRDRGFGTHLAPENIWLEAVTIEPAFFEVRGRATDPNLVAEFMSRLETHPRDAERFFLRPELESYTTEDDAFFGSIRRFAARGGINYQRMR
jgi:type IV pilus assembly protein PilN